MSLYALDFPSSKGLVKGEESFAAANTPAGWVCEHKKPLELSPLRDALNRFPSNITKKLIEEGIQSMIWVPLQTRNRVLGALSVGVKSERKFNDEDIEHMLQASHQAAIALENAFAFREIAELRDRLAEEKLYLEDEIRSEFNFDEIVGDSPALNRILKQVEIVAPTDSTVLILGETGTGKELIARAIHKLSRRSARTFVKLSCPAIPAGLLESELFGHERGAFTGAISQKIGRVELANGGTLFLDEVGDLPLELQPKLLRLLQEREFERLGSTRTLTADVRVIAATNRDLAQTVAEGKFRSDLYYRLYVFPITAPPLRDRREDIPILVRYFTQKYSRRMNRHIETISSEAMHALTRWEWPGNIRELENFVERAVILTSGKSLRVPLEELHGNSAGARHAPAAPITDSDDKLEDSERKHILKVLRETNGVVAGPYGAAARLGLKRTTLQSKMQKLGIDRKDVTR
jgi:formate hydrogenlyase transcriptional activator